MRHIPFAILCLLIFCQRSFAQGTKDLVRISDMLKIRSVSALTLSKDGSKAVFTLNCIEPDGESKTDYKYVAHLYMVATDGSQPPKELTIKESSGSPAWSPDGRQLAFVRAADGKPQIFILPVDGGEPVQFTHYKYGAVSPKWSPDGSRILFSSSIDMADLLKDSSLNPEYALPKWPAEQPGFESNASLLLPVAKANPDGGADEIRAYLEADLVDKKAKILTRLDFQDESQVSSELSFNHFFVQDLRPGSQPVAVTHGFYNFNSAQFTPNGKQLLLVGDIDSTEHPDRSQETEVFIADSNGHNLRLLLGKPKVSYTGAVISPSGNWLAVQVARTDSIDIAQLALVPLSAHTGAVSDADLIIIPFDRDKNSCTWSRDEKYLYFTTSSNGAFPLMRLNIATKKLEAITDSSSGVGSFDLQTNRLVYVKTSVDNPFEVYTAELGGEHAKPITHFNADWLQSKKLSMPEKHSFTNEQGMVVDYWIMKPTNYQAGKKYPLLLEIHGGPSAMWGPGEASMWLEFQYFCSRGYGVVYSNPRGSGGYGVNFLRANIKDWANGPTRDVLTAMDNCIAAGWADTSKLLISGGSYGGYLVAWIIAHDHRFKAACSQRGVYDLGTFFGEGNAWRLVPYYFGGYPWETAVRSVLVDQSPLNYVQQITTPYIMFHGENDRRTGFVQGEMMFRSLKVLERPVEYVRHPGATHEITRSGDNRQRIDQLLRTYEFFERWLGKQKFGSK